MCTYDENFLLLMILPEHLNWHCFSDGHITFSNLVLVSYIPQRILLRHPASKYLPIHFSFFYVYFQAAF